MSRFFTLLLVLVISSCSFGASIVTAPVNRNVKASELYFSLNQHQVSLQDLSTMSAADFARLSGKKMNLIDKMRFKIAQKELRKTINSNGTVNDSKMKKFMSRAGGEDFNIGGFALGLILGPIGVLIAYLINDDRKRERVKWSWIGLIGWVIIVILL